MRQLIPRLGFPVTIFGLGASSKGIYRISDFALAGSLFLIAIIGCLNKEKIWRSLWSTIDWAQGFDLMYLGFGFTLASTGNKFNSISPLTSFLFLMTGFVFLVPGFWGLGSFIGKQIAIFPRISHLWSLCAGVAFLIAGGVVTGTKWDWISEKPSYNALLSIVLIGFGLILIYSARNKNSLMNTKHKEKSHSKGSKAAVQVDADKYYEVVLKERELLSNALLDQSRSFDKYILTLAAGSFGLSLLFMKQIAPHPQTETLWLLKVSWGTFAFAILCTLLSFLFSQKACLKNMSNMEKQLAEKQINLNNCQNPWTLVTSMLNWLSMISFMCGVALLATFAIRNLSTTFGG